MSIDTKPLNRTRSSGPRPHFVPSGWLAVLDAFDLVGRQRGAFTNIEVPGRGMLAKVSLDGSQFVEVVTLGTGVLISYGACR